MSIHTCSLTVKGKGRFAHHGHTVGDRTKRVKDFLVDNGVLYTAVYQHVKECQDPDPCDPVEVLRVYLARRDRTPKFKGHVSIGLINLALKYERSFDLPDGLVDEFMVRGLNYETLLTYSDRLGIDGVVDGVLRIDERCREKGSSPAFHVTAEYRDHPLIHLVHYAWSRFSLNRPVGTRDELVRMAAVWEVLNT